MNRRILVVVSIIASAIMLSGCVNSISKTDKITPAEDAGIKSSVSSTSAQAEKGANDESSSTNIEVSTNQPDNTKVDYNKIGFDLEAAESLFILNNSLLDIDVVKFLDEPERKSEPIVWGADGLEHQTWYYSSKGIELGFIKNDENKQVVFSIKLESPCTLKTSRGIGIGNTKDEVLKAYKDEINPEESFVDSSNIVAGTVYGGLIFTLENNLVSSIFIGAAAE